MGTKEMRGITLIALVITIVIIMILAGVTINLVVGNNNLFDKAKSTQKIQTVAGIKEALELEKVDIQVESKKVDLDTYLEQISTGKKNYNLSFKEKVDEKNAEIIVNDEYKFLVKDKENGDVEIIYDGIAKAEDLTISSKNGTYTYPNSGTFEVTNNTSRGELTVSSDASNIATASIDGNTITVMPGTIAGKANIIVKSAANGEYAENKVIHVATVKNGTIELEAIPYDGVYDGQAHNALTNVTVNPSDAAIEYSTDGTTYSTTMPTVTNSSSFTVTVRASKAGYKTQSVTETVNVKKAAGSLSLSSYSGTITYPNSTSFTASGTGSISAVSSNTGVATVSVSGNTITVRSVAAGSATITVTSAAATNYNAKSTTYSVTVNLPMFTASSGVGYYADVDGNGTVDGIIYADRKIGASGTWGHGLYDYKYSISKVSSTKNYYISQKNYSGVFGTKDVLSPTGSGNKRFYVMALSDYSGSTYKFSNAKNIKSGEWAVPSPNSWATFLGQLGITANNYGNYGLKKEYWTSEPNYNENCFSDGMYVSFSRDGITAIDNINAHVRLSRTF